MGFKRNIVRRFLQQVVPSREQEQDSNVNSQSSSMSERSGTLSPTISTSSSSQINEPQEEGRRVIDLYPSEPLNLVTNKRQLSDNSSLQKPKKARTQNLHDNVNNHVTIEYSEAVTPQSPIPTNNSSSYSSLEKNERREED